MNMELNFSNHWKIFSALKMISFIGLEYTGYGSEGFGVRVELLNFAWEIEVFK